MKTEVLDTSPASIVRAAECLRAGWLVAFPTETVYGLGAHALDVAAVRRLFEAKGRPTNDPLIVHVSSFDDVAELLGPDLETGPYSRARRLAAQFWPGPLTLVLPRSDRVPPDVTAGLETVAVRVPAHPVARALLEAAALPIAAPSANLFSRPSPTCAAHVLQDLDGRIDIVLDGGPTGVGLESTVLDLTCPEPTVLRPGAITVEMLRELLPIVRVRDAPAAPAERRSMPSPGLLARHYSPRAPLTLFSGHPAAALQALVARARDEASQGRRVGVLVTHEDVGAVREAPVHVAEMGSRADPEKMAASLYAALRQLDAAGVDIILARDVEGTRGLVRAIRDRLARAASERVQED
ncbi:MAG: L-threonylcarbamoyladenylate synthase [Vicinamibacterales bacterium]